MPGQNYLTISPSSISLTYNIFDNSLSGDNLITVQARYDSGGDFPSDDAFTVSGDSVFSFDDSDQSTYFRVEINSLNNPTVEGDFNYNVIVTGYNSGMQKTLIVSLKVVNTDTTPPAEKEYKTKYYIQRDNYFLLINELTNEDIISKEINGTVDFSYQNKNDLFEPIIASNLKLNLEDGQDIGLSDLYSEEEKQFQVLLYLNSKTLFIGFIKPDGIWEDYVSDRWFLSIQCIDGLSTLKNISFSNANGIVYSGKRSLLSVITDCISKTALNLSININCNLFYEGFDSFDNILDNVIINTERYFQNADQPMDCETVLKSLLTIFNCSLIQMDGEWWIFRTIDLDLNTSFSKYIDGVFAYNFEYEPNKSIGSQIDNFENFHCNKNQKKSIGASVQAFKISYEYGPANSVFRNPELKLDGSGLNIDGWSVTNVDSKVSRNENGYGLQAKTVDFNANIPVFLELNQSIDIQVGASFNLSINFTNDSSNITSASSFGLRFGVAIGDLWLQDNGEWSTNVSSIYIANSDPYTINVGNTPFLIFKGKGDANYTAQIKAPKSGALRIAIYRDSPPEDFLVVLQEGIFKINSIFLSGTNNGDIKGIDYTAQRTQKTSTVTKSDKTVYNGDSVSDLFVGTIYKYDSDTPTEKWYREGQIESKELLSINVEDNLRLSPRPMIIFEGDVYGFIPYLSVVLINNFDNKKFQFLNWSYSLDKNIIKTSLKEYSDDYLTDEDFRIDVRYNYGQQTKTTLLA